MAEKAFGTSREENLDWNNLSGPVPLDFIDPEFPPHPPEPERPPGARSEILPREESEALARAHADAPQSPASDAGSGSPDSPADVPMPTLEMPARAEGGSATLGGWPQDHAEIQDEFARLRAKMDAEAEAETKAKQEAEKEEASQRERLEQWMANARARLLKADADLTGPSARIRIRKDHSPSLYRLAEMQKTLIVEGEAGPQSPAGTVADAPRRPEPLDPMATLSVPVDQFLTLDAPAQPTEREQALARQAAQQTAAQQMSQQLAETRMAKDLAAAFQGKLPKNDQPYPSGEIRMDQIPATMTREQALTRKVAQLRKVAEGPEGAPGDEVPERTALHVAIAVLVIVAIAVLGLGLFAATQAGLFDGLENRVPFLRPKMSAIQLRRPAARPAPRPSQSGPATAAPAGVRPSAAARRLPTEPVPAAAPVAPVAQAPRATSNAAVTQYVPRAVPAPQRIVPAGKAPAAKPVSARASLPMPAAQRPVRTPAARTNQAVPADEDGEIPAYAKAPPKPGNVGEIILRASIQAAANIDADNLQEMYNRYALGFPGLSGEVVIGLTVDPGGRILEGSIVSSTTGVQAFDQELLRKVLDWRLRSFPESRPKFITVPFLFPLQGR